MHRRRAAAALVLALGLGAGPAGAEPTPSYTYPPPAPAKTGRGTSPGAPDPHPPAGGIGPDDAVVGGPLLASRTVVRPAGARLPKGVNAQAWIVVDLDTGDVIAARDPHGRYQPASILKVLTCATLIPRLPGGAQVVVSKTAAETEGSHAGLVERGRYTVDDLFRGLLLVSGNDAAMALAEAAGGVRRTVALMNAEALALGAYDTYVETPSGLDGWKQLTSVYDMALFLRAALALPRFVAYDRTAHAVLPKNRIVGRVPLWNQSSFWLERPGSIVAKSGFTDAARHTWIAAKEQHGRRLGVVLLRAERWPLDTWQQADRLFAWAGRLPAGTPAVGELAPPVRPPAAERTSAPPSPRTSAAAAAATRPAAGDSGWSPGLVAGLAALLAAAVLAARRLRRRAPPAQPVR